MVGMVTGVLLGGGIASNERDRGALTRRAWQQTTTVGFSSFLVADSAALQSIGKLTVSGLLTVALCSVLLMLVVGQAQLLALARVDTELIEPTTPGRIP